MLFYDQDYFYALAIANNSQTWSFIAATLPPRRAGASVIYDAPRQRLIVYGGAQDNLYATNDTWAYSLTGGGWSFLGQGPHTLQSHTAVFDPIANRMIVFGGRADGVAQNSVYSLSLTGTPTWSGISPTGTGPVGLYQHTAIFDVPRNRMIVYGGSTEFTGLMGDTIWVLSLAGTPSWSQLIASGARPPARWQHTAVFDAPRNRMLVFGGYTDFSNTLADPTVWALDLAGPPAWSPLSVGGGATPMADHVAVYDPSRDAMLAAGQDLSSVQALNLSSSPSWGALGLVGPAPAGRLGAAAAFDTGNDRWVVTSGYNGPYRNDVIALSFPSTPYGLDLQVSPAGSGNVQANPNGKCFNPGTMVTLTAFAGVGYTFSNWSGDATGSTNPLTVTMNSSMSITANFVGYPVNVTVAPAGSGTVSKSPNQATYAPGTQVTLTANSSVPFLGWSGDASGSTNPLTVTVDGPKNITATFDANTITAAVTPLGTGTVRKSPDQSFYATGTVVTLQANPLTGYQFSSWSGDTTSTDNPIMLTVNGNKSVTAHIAVPPPACGAWTLIPVTSGPSARSQSATIWDPVRHRMLIYGGVQHNLFSALGDTWALTIGSTPAWSLIVPGSGGRWDMSPFYDSLRDRFVFYGGTSGQGIYGSDLWALPLTGTPTWSQIRTAGAGPGARYGANVIYDPLRDRVILFGGGIRCGLGCTTLQNDVWQLTLAGTPTWTQIFPLGTPPPVRYYAGAIYDPVRDRLVIMAGAGATPNGAWALNLSGTPTWTDLNPWGAPHAMNSFQAMYDPIRDRALLFNADGSGQVTALDFKLDPNQPQWSPFYPSGALLGTRYGIAATYDPDLDLAALFGGTNSSSSDFDASFRLDLGGCFQVDVGGTNGHIETTKWFYGSGEVASLLASPNQGYKLSQWLGDGSGTSNPLQLTMDGYKVVRAEFMTAVDGVDETPVAFALSVHPNPSIGPTKVEYALPRQAPVKLRVFDVAGREVARLVDGMQPAGRHLANWNGLVAATQMRSGIYVIRYETPAGNWTRRLALLR
jgi:hypothetical protein